MPVSNLNLYDILVDLIPGAVGVGLVISLFGWMNLTATSGLILLVVGYVVGRIIHALGSIQPVIWLMKGLEDAVVGSYTRKRKHGLSFRNRLRTVFDDDFEAELADDNGGRIEREIVKDVVNALEKQLGDVDFPRNEIKSHTEVKSSDTRKSTDPVLSFRYFGENFLYGRNTLYRKYEMLATFYRSLWLVSVSVSCLYIASILLTIPDWNSPAESIELQLSLITILLLCASYISLRQRIKYKFKKTRAFFNDLYLELDLPNPE